MKKKIAVIGSGFAGMSAAAYLAKAGHEVVVYEKNASPGGRAGIWHSHGFVFDLGPSWYWMPEVFDQFYADFGFTSSDFYDLIRLNPSYRVFFSDDKVDIPKELTELQALFESYEKGSGKQLEQFLQDAEYKYHTAMTDYVKRPSHSIWEFMEWHLLVKAFKMRLFTPIRKEIAERVTHPKLKAILEFPVLFLGATPQKTPSLYSMMNYADLVLGTWYPMKGMHEISKAFQKVGESVGVKFKFEHEVLEIKVNGNAIQSMTTNKGEVTADFVIGAGDYHHIEQQLLPPSHRVYSESYWQKRTMSPSSLLFYLGVSRKISGLLHHNLFFDEHFDDHAYEIYTEPQWPKKPLFYACVPSVTDPSVAPDGMENMFLLMPLAPGLEDSDDMREKYYHIMMERLEQKTGISIKEHVIVKRSYCLQDFKSDYHSFKGNAYGLANTLQQTAFLKPAMKSAKIHNLLYTGQLTVPGPGVPPSIISGQIASREALKYFKKQERH
jgi:phytoene desaturase